MKPFFARLARLNRRARVLVTLATLALIVIVVVAVVSTHAGLRTAVQQQVVRLLPGFSAHCVGCMKSCEGSSSPTCIEDHCKNFCN